MVITKGIISEWVWSQDFAANRNSTTVKAKKAITVKNLINLDLEALVKNWINLGIIQFWILDLEGIHLKAISF